ncbi:hypothetical protein GWI33_015717 [Rhynchophorus ferrugineus]|uniref:Uncharacterized protein n=1 Tax=Rhynchophorus ferrugineus TaxID=354439 RepID=A0A834M461_RHYFE|nr:hypothetical protein GWI33_015717 [Rhynchophorus ferrugineus]
MDKNEYTIAINDLNNVCRTCLCHASELKPIYEIYLDNNVEVDVSQVFKQCCKLDLDRFDNKPQNICNSCIMLLVQSVCFFDKVIKSNNILDDLLNKEELYNDGSEAIEDKSKKEKVSVSDTEDDAFMENDNDSDWAPMKNDVNNRNVKIESTPDFYCFRKERHTSVEVFQDDLDNQRRLVKRKFQKAKQSPKRRGRPRKHPEGLENVLVKNSKEFECRLCQEYISDINTAIDHYDENHGPQADINKCILCEKPKGYKNRDNLLYHMALHSKDSAKCIPCRKYFKNDDLLKQHLQECLKSSENILNVKQEECDDEIIKQEATKTVNRGQLPAKILKETQVDGAFTCQLCVNKSLGDINTVIEHYENEHIDDLQCIICLRTFTKRVPLFHLSLHSRKSHVCRPCRRYFKTKEQYNEHNIKYDHDNSLTCRFCGKTFTRKYKKNKHMLSHLNEKNYSCNKCGKTFTYKTSLVRHFKMHFGKRFLCSACGNAYTTKFMLQRHFNLVHKNVDAEGNPLPRPPPTPVNLQCEFCGEIFNTRYGYGRHIRRHPEFTEYKCKICSVTCDTREQLDEHMDERHNKHTCEVCGKRYAFESELKTHFRQHEDIKLAKFRCDTCGKVARTSNQLKIHMRIHTGERPFSCDTCGKSFRQTAHLKVHMYQHTGTMPFKCKICEKCFPFQHILEIHLRTHTGERPFKCTICGSAYYDRTTLHKHQKKKHPEVPIPKWSRSEYKMSKL